MYAVGRIGSYITQGVVSVSAPFHPFGGAVDIVIVEQQDGTFKSSPWYVRFGKFQGVLKAREKVVSINVNGVDAGFHMHLDHRGEAYFLREVEGDQDIASDLHPCSSGDEIDVRSDMWRQGKTKSFDYDARKADSDSEIVASNGKKLARSNSQKPRVFGLVFGRRSQKKEEEKEEVSGEVIRRGSLERAEIAADLLEVRWSTNLASRRKGKNDAKVPNGRKLVCGVDRSSRAKKTPGNTTEDRDAQSPEQSQGSSPPSQGHYMETFVVKEAYLETLYGGDIAEDSQTSDSTGTAVNDDDKVPTINVSEILRSSLGVSHSEGLEVTTSRISSEGIMSDGGHSPVSYESEESIRGGENESDEHASGALLTVSLVAGELSVPDQAPEESSESISEMNLGPLIGMAALEVNPNAEILNTKDCNSEHGISSSAAGSETAAGLDINGPCTMREEHTGSCSPVIGLQPSDPCTVFYALASPHPNSYDESFSNSTTDHPPALNDEESADDNISKSKTSSDSLENSEEVQFLFSDLENLAISDTTPSNFMDKGGNHQDGLECSEEEVNESAGRDDGSQSFEEKCLQRDQLTDSVPNGVETSSQISSAISIQNADRKIDQGSSRMRGESLPIMRSPAHDINRLLSQSLNLNIDSSRLPQKDASFSSRIAAEEIPYSASEQNHYEELKKIIYDPAVELSLCRHLFCEGMGYEAAARVFDADKLDVDKFASLAPDITKDERLVVRIGGLYFPWDAALPIASAIGSDGKQVLEPKGMIVVDQAGKTLEEEPPKSTNTKNGSWRFWPFSFRRSESMQSSSSDFDSTSVSPRGVLRDTDTIKPEVKKPEVKRKTVRERIPTSEQLASLNLKEGKNVVTFTFSTSMLGDQQVEARIYLWKWNARIVISDVDGTITRSDVLGQFMPLVGIDWSQTGVTHLFSAIKENGYQLLFLSARAISQAYHTRQFLFNLKQDGKSLPEGPVVISPDGLFPSLYREVIRRAPHEFKISCLEEIRALFPPESNPNPFYAGFGNRDTDEISYLKVGIPRGKIFTINPKGEVAVHRRVDTKSYTSLHTLVHDMFPPAAAFSATEQEDFNSWNFWRLPPPDISSI